MALGVDGTWWIANGTRLCVNGTCAGAILPPPLTLTLTSLNQDLATYMMHNSVIMGESVSSMCTINLG